MVRGGIPLEEWSGSGATKALHETTKELLQTTRTLRQTIDEYQKQSSRQTRWLIWLTFAIAVLTVVLVFGLGFQIGFAVWGLPQATAPSAAASAATVAGSSTR
jgi:hypothetical protein